MSPNDVLEFFSMLVSALANWTIGTVHACLPVGVLPRKDVRDRIVLITGSGSGLGRVFSVEFARLGAKVVLWDVNASGNEQTAKLVREAGGTAFAYTVDLSRSEDIYENAKRVKKDVGVVDILINNAGVVTGKKLFDISDEAMRLTMAVNTHALFYMAKAFLPDMLERDSGHFVTIASMAGKAGVAGLVDYCASKYGAVGITDSLRGEMLQSGSQVKVTLICPYFVNTGMFDGVKAYSPNVLPILDVDYVIEHSMEAILTEQAELFMPKFCYGMYVLGSLLPTRASVVIARYLGLNDGMQHFVGRQKTH